MAPSTDVETLPTQRRAEAADEVVRQLVGDVQGKATSTQLMARYRSIVIASDLIVSAIAALIALMVRFGDNPPWYYAFASLLFPFTWVAAIAVQRGYEARFLGTGPDEYRRLSDAVLAYFAITAAISFIFKGDVSRAYVIVVLPMSLVLSFFSRRSLRRWLFSHRLAGDGLQRVLVVGRADAVAHLVEKFDREPWHGLVAVGACLPSASTHIDLALGERIPVLGDPADILGAVDAMNIEVVAVVSHPDMSGQTLRRLGWALDERGVDLVVSPGIVEVAGPRLSIRPIAGLSLLHLDHPGIHGARMAVKVVADRLLAIMILVLASPVLIGAAIAVRLSSPGPVIFSQTRIGVNGREFQILKFRSMVVDAEARRDDLMVQNENDGLMFKIRNDPRITPVGAFIRRYSIDELPQLWNVVRGEMSLVGPRPPLPEEVAQYDRDAGRRLQVKPGLTGLWQVSGRSDLSWDEALALDLRYVDNWTFWLDAAILWRTGRAVLGRNGAY